MSTKTKEKNTLANVLQNQKEMGRYIEYLWMTLATQLEASMPAGFRVFAEKMHWSSNHPTNKFMLPTHLKEMVRIHPEKTKILISRTHVEDYGFLTVDEAKRQIATLALMWQSSVIITIEDSDRDDYLVVRLQANLTSS